MRFVGIVSSGLVSGSYNNGGRASDISALKTTSHSKRNSQITPRAWSRNQSVTVVHVSGCLLLDSE